MTAKYEKTFGAGGTKPRSPTLRQRVAGMRVKTLYLAGGDPGSLSAGPTDVVRVEECQPRGDGDCRSWLVEFKNGSVRRYFRAAPGVEGVTSVAYEETES